MIVMRGVVARQAHNVFRILHAVDSARETLIVDTNEYEVSNTPERRPKSLIARVQQIRTLLPSPKEHGEYPQLFIQLDAGAQGYAVATTFRVVEAQVVEPHQVSGGVTGALHFS